MSHGPDWSDSEDSLFGDDGDYENFKKVKVKPQNSFYNDPPQLTEEQKKQQDLNLFFNSLSNGNVDAVLDFLNKGYGANLDIRDGWTPLLLAASYGNLDLTKVLIENGGAVNQNRDGVTALMMVCSCPDYTSPYEISVEVVKLLVKNGANVQTVNRKRMDALMYAACTGNLLAVKYLLPKANKQAVDNQRWNALTWAVSNNQIEVVEYLMSEDFDIYLTDVRGNTPLDLAKELGLESIINLFPKKELDLITDLIETHRLDFHDHFGCLKNGEKPIFFGDICDILTAVKCRHLIPIFLEKNVSWDEFLSMDNNDLMKVGVLLPYQRRRILTGIHRFHKRPYHPKSIHVCVNSDTYSNIDVAKQLMSATQQVIAMEASLKFIQKVIERGDLTKEQKEIAYKCVNNIKLKIKGCRMVIKKLQERFKEWDSRVEPADIITRNSIRSKIPWKKLTFCLGILSVIIVCKIRK